MSKIFTKEENRNWSSRLRGKMCSACIALCSHGKVLMVKTKYKDHWTFPSGIVDPNESPQAAAIRETYEEVGLRVSDAGCTLLAVVYTAANDGERDRFNFAFVTDAVDQNSSLSVPNDEIEAAEWVRFAEIAKRSGNRGSYVHFQRVLLNRENSEPYAEV